MSERPDIVLQNGAATLRFFWVEDRYQHRFERADVSVESFDLEGTDCPVFTDLHQQGDLLFASGNAGIGHWSAAISPHGDGFLFDVAIRLSRTADSIASAYAGANALSAIDDSATITNTDSQIVISPAAAILAPVSTVHYKYVLV